MAPALKESSFYPELIKEANTNEKMLFGHLPRDDQQVFIDVLKKNIAIQKWDSVLTN